MRAWLWSYFYFLFNLLNFIFNFSSSLIPLSQPTRPIRPNILGSCRVVGVGFGLEGDLGMLAHYPDLTDICAEALAKRLYLDFKHTVDCRSLSDLCQRTLLAKLNKTMQISDWSRRPLSEDQLTVSEGEGAVTPDQPTRQAVPWEM